MTKKKISRLSELGVYGFNEVEPVILTALVTRDPLLLIGDTGTGKTFLLNSLSEAMGLVHRHYNASLISFDDLVGFPYPDTENSGVRFLETPATVWGAESVLIDEISRCKPEHQNRLFSLIHERRLQGIALSKLVYRWAAMNPCSLDKASYQDYIGSEPLDPALADRFSLFVRAVDWNEFTAEEKVAIANPGGEGVISNDGGSLKEAVANWREEYLQHLQQIPPDILTYVTTAADLFRSSKIRISPRRTQMVCKSLLAAVVISGKASSGLFKQILTCSLPQVAWGEEVSPEIISAVNRSAWDNAHSTSEQMWVNSFVLADTLPKKLELLVNNCPDKDLGTQAIEQLIANESRERMAAFALAVFPAASLGILPIGSEGVHDLGQIAIPAFSVDGEIKWQERTNTSNSQHPEFLRYAKVLENLEGARRQLASQLFNWCLVNNLVLPAPDQLEEEMNKCVHIIRSLD